MNYKINVHGIKSKEEYEKTYPKKISQSPEITNFTKTKEALDKALDIRKFEIELYWKRAGYFWAFIALTFTSFFIIFASDKVNIDIKNDFSLLLSGLGLFLSISWFFANKGSKYWQENWEKHVDLLEDDIIGPLYKTTLYYEEKKLDIINPIKPYRFSVGKINQLLSFSMVLVWVYLVCLSISNIFNIVEPFRNFNAVAMLSCFLIVFYILLFKTKSSTKNGGDFTMQRREFNE